MQEGARALKRAFNYYDAVVNVDISRADKTIRDPERVKRLMRSYARLQGTQSGLKAIKLDMIANDVSKLDEDTVASYIKALKKIFVIEDAVVWCPNLRNKAVVRTSDTRYYSDSSIAAAALGIGPDDLMNDLRTFGLLFETMVMRDLRCYAEALGGTKIFQREKSREESNMSLMDTSDKDFVGRIASLPLFAGCGSRVRELVRLLRARVHEYAPGEMVVCECDKASSVLVVLSGCVKVTECGPKEDTRYLVDCLDPGGTFGATLPALGLATYPGLVEAKDPSAILFLDVGVIRTWFASGSEPRFLANLYAVASRQGYSAWRKCALLSCYEISDRLKLYLRWLTDNGQPIPAKFDVPLLAATLGVNRTALYRAVETIKRM